MQVEGADLVPLYVVQCAIEGWIHRIPAERCTGAQGLLPAIMGSTVFMLAFFEKWLGTISADHNECDWLGLLFVSPSFSAIRKLTECIGRPDSIYAWRYDGVERCGVQEEDTKGVYVTLLCRRWGI